MTNCHSSGQVTCIGYYGGGFCGNLQVDGIVINCSTSCSVLGDHTFIGGFCGSVNGTITNCNASGEVQSNYGYVGGFAGAGTYGSMSQCYATGNVTSTTSNVGGFMGGSLGSEYVIDQCYATGNVVSNSSQAGGFIGGNTTGVITNCYATGNARGTHNIGGFVGINHGPLLYCYSIGEVTSSNGDSRIGGLCGTSDGTIADSYYDTQTSGRSDTGKGIPKTTVQMMQEATFAAWDFADVWDIYEGRIYPVLQWMPISPQQAQIWHVDGAGGDNGNDGLTRATAFATIQFAIDQAAVIDGDTVLVWPGVYNESATLGINFKGKAITVKSAADAAVLEVPDFAAVRFTYGEDSNSVLSNFVIRGSDYGILALYSDPTISNVTVVNNTNGIIADIANPTITNCIFWNNTNGDLIGIPYPITAQYSFVGEDFDDPVAYWKLDGDATDSAGSNDGTIYGATTTTGQVGDSLEFDGEGDYVDCGNNDSLDMADALTVSAWIKRSSFSTIGTIIGKNNGNSVTAGYSLHSYTQGLQLQFYSSNRWRRTTPRVAVTANQWHHVVGTFNGNVAYLYVDGEQRASLVHNGDIAIAAGYPVQIAYWRSQRPEYFKGSIDEVAIFDTALSADQIEAMYQAGLAGGEYADPGFVDPDANDYHLLSERGRYRATTDEWILDNVTSVCVDGGDPNIEPTEERMPNGGRINMGAYGNTASASMSEWEIKADLNRDGIVDIKDFAIFAQSWLQQEEWKD